nr:MAG TPA: hypothetical protein [Microviridae sp.]
MSVSEFEIQGGSTANLMAVLALRVRAPAKSGAPKLALHLLDNIVLIDTMQ